MRPRPTKPISVSADDRMTVKLERPARTRVEVSDAAVGGEQDSCLDMGTPDRAQQHRVLHTLRWTTADVVTGGSCACLSLPRSTSSCLDFRKIVVHLAPAIVPALPADQLRSCK